MTPVKRFMLDVQEIAMGLECSPAWVLLFAPGMALLGTLADPWSLVLFLKGD